MFETIKILHFAGIILGFGGGIGNAVAAARLATLPPETGPIVGGFRAALGHISTLGIVILWLSGIALINMRGNQEILSDQVFQLKLAAVIILTGFSLVANLTVLAAKKAGAPPDPKRMELVGKGAMISAAIALILAVMAFN